MSKPYVSVLIDTYNYEQFVEQAIIRVLEQEMSTLNLETQIMDDGSDDRTSTKSLVLSLIGIKGLEFRMRSVLSHG